MPRLFDGRALIRDGAVAIKGDAIVAVGKRNDVDVDAKRTIRLVVRRGAIQVGGWRLDSMPWRRPRRAPGGAS